MISFIRSISILSCAFILEIMAKNSGIWDEFEGVFISVGSQLFLILLLLLFFLRGLTEEANCNC
jgi:hypothetical protein